MLEWIVSTVSSLGYLGITLLMFLENLFPPIPSELIMPLAGFTASQGELNTALAVVAGIVGSVLGALLWYFIGDWVGEARLKQIADQYGKWLTVSSQDIDKASGWFERRGSFAVFVGRIIPGIRTFISVPAGISRMHLLPFLVYTTLGSAVWVTLLTYLGYSLGRNYPVVERFIGPISAIILLSLMTAFVVWVIKRRQQRGQ
ncbi:DedA family protein [Oculatella sp. LEGE 06141]|uniref:DedA family protein n=1 Tax=Oculatella sp. LEGE 06141 TaxID=1828648 RepID=UPI00187F1928|nr:DedA family protein [Oculatella sp. LEGE 06141]MBE9181644.1 DedA family protein [Oculatella sp. LEGE 06141]